MPSLASRQRTVQNPFLELVRDPPGCALAERDLDGKEPIGDEGVERALREPGQLLDLAATKQADAAALRYLGRVEVPGGERWSRTRAARSAGRAEHALSQKGVEDMLGDAAGAARHCPERREAAPLDQAVYVGERERRSFTDLAGAQHAIRGRTADEWNSRLS